MRWPYNCCISTTSTPVLAVRFSLSSCANGCAIQRLEPFSLGLYEGVVAHADDIDRRLAAAAENWRVVRMAVVDRNVLRLGGYELLYTPETPTNVAFDEAIELARRYGSASSPAFVNGVLDRLRQDAAPPV